MPRITKSTNNAQYPGKYSLISHPDSYDSTKRRFRKMFKGNLCLDQIVGVFRLHDRLVDGTIDCIIGIIQMYELLDINPCFRAERIFKRLMDMLDHVSHQGQQYIIYLAISSYFLEEDIMDRLILFYDSDAKKKLSEMADVFFMVRKSPYAKRLHLFRQKVDDCISFIHHKLRELE